MVTFATDEIKEYEEYVKAKLAQDKLNKKIARRKLLKEDAKRSAEIGPAWYQGLSYKQAKAVEALGYNLWRDIEEGVPVKSLEILVKLGINPKPSHKTLMYAMRRCYMNPILFLIYLYKAFGTTPLNNNEKYFSVNDRLILSAMAYLALPRTLAELCLRLPRICPQRKDYPVVHRKQFSQKESPYLELLPYYKQCVRAEETEAIRKRKNYLKKFNALREQQKPVLPYIKLFEIYHSMRYDGRDEIPNEELIKQKQVKPKKKFKFNPKRDKTKKLDDKQASEESLLSQILCESDLKLMQCNNMRLPEPILTEQTIIALLAGYWQNIYGPFTPPSATAEEQELVEKGGSTVMLCLARRALARMAKRGNPLASLQGSHTLPQIKQLVRRLCNFELNQKHKDCLLHRSHQSWNVSLAHTPQIICKPLEFGSSLTWGSVYSFKKKNNEYTETYLNRVCRAMVDDTREFWSSMATDYFNIPGFAKIFFTYVPSRVEDIVFQYAD